MTTKNSEHFDMRALIRLAIWGGTAVVALLIVVLAGRSDVGVQRLKVAYSAITRPAEPPRPAPAATPALVQPAPATAQLLARAAELENETRRLAETVRSLSADRDRLVTRLAGIERNLDDMTGSIARVRANADASPQPPTTPPPEPSPPAVTAPAVTAPAASPPPVNTPLGPTVVGSIAITPLLPPGAWDFQLATRVATAHAVATGEDPPGDSVASRTEFGVDIGGAGNVAALRALWANAKTVYASLLEGLRPVVAIREGKAGAFGLRLVVGPLSNAGAAAKLCASLAAAGLACRQAVFDGQRLALR